MELSETQIFIVGTQRSGTTLLRLILNAHSQIAIPEEGRFLLPLLSKDYINKPISGNSLSNLVKYLSQNPQYNLWNYNKEEFLSNLSKKKEISLRDFIDSLYCSYAHSEGKTIWGDKSLFFGSVSILNSIFPEARFIHVVRDGRGVFDSHRRMVPSYNNVSVAALDWVSKLYMIQKSFKKIPDNNKITIRYEDILENPENISRSICSFIGLEYETSMLNFYRTSHKYIGEHHSKLIFKPINKSNTYIWKKNLEHKEIRIFSKVSRYFLKRFNYEINNESLMLSDIFFLMKELSLGLPKRIAEIVETRWTLKQALKKGVAAKMDVGQMPKIKK